jgi:hypothetical protein
MLSRQNLSRSFIGCFIPCSFSPAHAMPANKNRVLTLNTGPGCRVRAQLGVYEYRYLVLGGRPALSADNYGYLKMSGSGRL